MSSEREPHYPDEIIGEYPAYIENIAAEIHVTDIIAQSEKELKKIGKAFSEKNPDWIIHAEETGKDIVGVTYGKGVKVFIGAGLIGLGLGAISYGIYNYSHHKQKNTKSR